MRRNVTAQGPKRKMLTFPRLRMFFLKHHEFKLADRRKAIYVVIAWKIIQTLTNRPFHLRYWARARSVRTSCAASSSWAYSFGNCMIVTTEAGKELLYALRTQSEEDLDSPASEVLQS